MTGPVRRDGPGDGVDDAAAGAAAPTGSAPTDLPARTEGRAVAALVLALVSVTVFPIVPAVAALVVASGARRAIEQSQGLRTGHRLVVAARIIAWTGLALGVALVGLLVFAVVALRDFTPGPEDITLGL